MHDNLYRELPSLCHIRAPSSLIKIISQAEKTGIFPANTVAIGNRNYFPICHRSLTPAPLRSTPPFKLGTRPSCDWAPPRRHPCAPAQCPTAAQPHPYSLRDREKPAPGGPERVGSHCRGCRVTRVGNAARPDQPEKRQDQIFPPSRVPYPIPIVGLLRQIKPQLLRPRLNWAYWRRHQVACFISILAICCLAAVGMIAGEHGRIGARCSQW